MPRSHTLSIDPLRYDFWLHTGVSVVGVLVILALVASAGVRRTIVPAAADTSSIEADLRQVRAAAITVERDVHRLDSEIKNLDSELEERKRDREILATIIVASENELARHRARLGDKSRGQYDLARDLALAKAELERLERERLTEVNRSPESLKIESYPTPLSKPVDGKEMHVQLRGGRVTILPVDDLVERLKNTAKEKVWKLRDYPEMTDTVGPVDGFRMKYTLIRVDINGQAALETGSRGGSYVTLDHWELVPVASDLGEPWKEALGPTSLLRARLDDMSPRQGTVTLWVYPDSFDAFRALRKDLYHLGYHVAGRPLPENMPIGGSPRGSKSAAQ